MWDGTSDQNPRASVMLSTEAAKDFLEWPRICLMMKKDFDLVVVLDIFAVENVGDPSHDLLDECFDSIFW
ncbi:hypothetical protein EPO44_19855 [bacterium]|nr:MAG: hypothetical protein EPO44_19855 [bacterium]